MHNVSTNVVNIQNSSKSPTENVHYCPHPSVSPGPVQCYHCQFRHLAPVYANRFLSDLPRTRYIFTCTICDSDSDCRYSIGIVTLWLTSMTASWLAWPSRYGVAILYGVREKSLPASMVSTSDFSALIAIFIADIILVCLSFAWNEDYSKPLKVYRCYIVCARNRVLLSLFASLFIAELGTCERLFSIF